ncbi:LysR family transcriptional regulator [Microbulbifer sp. CAU 1566]|uniref:LysR family transcriptional regulator n=1 Tax=Microbulbifer sp. CAU 1566 TaxID=2933269 RepID=UPI002005F924|nr:LysR family transcriptional regulator [Microbulbifer sp. CAU 1566]MCK7596192.1 LysR family transcriptional regulator [Microbulbifer sp. CAU 1566]
MAVDPSLYPSLVWFVRIAHHSSITKAAEEGEVSRAALSQHLKSLEQQLNVRLLNRSTRSMSLTEEGQRLFDVLTPAIESVDQAVAEVGESQAEPSGVIRINTSRVAARLLLEPKMETFLARYPKLKLELILDDGLSNIISSGMDAGIRLGESLAEHMVAVPVTPPMSMAIVGSPEYFAKHGTPETPDDLLQHNCLAFRFTSSGIIDRWAFTSPDADKRTLVFEPKGNGVFNDDESMLRAALNGVGVVQHLDLCVQQYLDDGSLVRVLQSWCEPFPGFFLYVPSRAQMPAKMRALIDFLVEQRDEFLRV